MLNRMDYLATQSANGTYQDEVDREALQKEVNQLCDEINRIADSANFNGIKLLDGSLNANGMPKTVSGSDRIIQEVADNTKTPADVGTVTFLDGAGPTEAVKTKFTMNFSDLEAKADAGENGGGNGGGTPATAAVGKVDIAWGAGATPTWANGDTVAVTSTGGDTDLNMTATFDGAAWTVTGAPTGYTATFDGTSFTLTADDAGAKADEPDYGTVTVNPTNAADNTLAGTGTASFTNGADAVDAPAGRAAGDPTPAVGTVAVTWGATPTWANGDTVAVTSTGGDTDLNMTATFDGTNWTVTGAPTGYTAAFDGTNFTLTADDAGAKADEPDYGTVTINPTNAADNTLTGTGAATFVNGTDGGNGGGDAGDATVTVKLNGENLAEDVSVAANASAKDIADAVYDALTDNADGPGKTATVNGVEYNVTNSNGVLTFEMKDDPTDADKVAGNFTWDVTIDGGSFAGSHTAGTNVVAAGSVASAGVRANTVFEITEADLQDGTVIELDGKKVTLSVGPNSKVTDKNAVKLAEGEDLNSALSKISEKFGGETTNFEVSVNRGAGDTKTGLAIYKKADSKQTYDSLPKLAGVFSIKTTTANTNAKALQLQIGDTSDSYNQLKVSIGDMHTEALGIDGLSIATAEDAANSIQTIKNAINAVSSVRGDLGAYQNRLEHTQNNLSVMAENIQDAESSIRDTDIAEEMMSYTKNNILVQSAQAMLAQANQVPQGVLQLLG